MLTLSAIGAGNMATAILSGVVASGFLAPKEIGTYDIHEEKQKLMTEKGYCGFSSVAELCQNSRYILLSTKPQQAEAVLHEMKPAFSKESVIISIAAGISKTFIQSILGEDAKVVLVMPNTPLLVGSGATAVSCCPPTTREEFEFVLAIFGSAGVVREIPNDKMNEIIAVNGSTPAYIYLIAKDFCEYAQAHGIDADTANALFCQTLVGAAQMMTQTGKSHQELIDMVSSPKGTTLMGLEVLEKGGLKELIHHCCDATIQRAYELGK